MRIRKITTPEDKKPEPSLELDVAISRFEIELSKESKGQNIYLVTIDGGLSTKIREAIEFTYIEAGWKKAYCITEDSGTPHYDNAKTCLKLHRFSD